MILSGGFFFSGGHPPLEDSPEDSPSRSDHAFDGGVFQRIMLMRLMMLMIGMLLVMPMSRMRLLPRTRRIYTVQYTYYTSYDDDVDADVCAGVSVHDDDVDGHDDAVGARNATLVLRTMMLMRMMVINVIMVMHCMVLMNREWLILYSANDIKCLPMVMWTIMRPMMMTDDVD